jgi:CRISPR-associated protein Csx10
MSALTLTLRQPAQVGDRARSDYVLGTLGYLPGAVVRGAFAAAWIARNGAPAPDSSRRAEFLRLFEGGVRFGALLPAGSQFLPLSVVGHKYPPPDDDCPEVEYDRAASDQVPARCPACESPFEQVRAARGKLVRISRRTSVAISSSGVALRSQLVTRDTLEPDQVFGGTIVAEDPASLGALAGLGAIRVGGRRTTHGLADVTIADGPPPPTAERRDDGRLILRLRSPGIFVDDEGRPARDPNPAELNTLLGCKVEVAARWTRWHPVGGWHLASGLPKPVDLAVAAGSTYLLEPSGPVPGQVLAELGQRGLGLRRQEGFGDLAPPPVLEPGRQARADERNRQRRLLDRTAPLRSLQIRAATWNALLDRLAGHAAGNREATAALRAMTGQLDPRVAGALSEFLALTPQDAAFVAGELRTL